MGCPIRKSPDQRLFAPPRSLSQLVTSFIASGSQGIHHALLVTSFCFSRISSCCYVLCISIQHVKDRYSYCKLFQKTRNVFFDKYLKKRQTTLYGIKGNHSRKEVFQPHLPVRLPCYDLAPVIGFTLGDFPLKRNHRLQAPPTSMA